MYKFYNQEKLKIFLNLIFNYLNEEQAENQEN